MAAAFDHKQFLAALPKRPGVYRMFGPEQELLYVGKARSLKDRVSTILPRATSTPRCRRWCAGQRNRGHGHELGDRGAAAGIQPHQGAQAALQHRAA
jgi:hypothetical protein